VVALRFPEFVSIATTRSHCPSCKKNLKWYDLFPLFSFLFLWGKCRYCKVKISWQYPLVELATGIITPGVIYFFGFTFQSIILILFSWILIIISIFDLESMEIPEFFLRMGIIFALIYLVFGYFNFGYNTDLLSAIYGVLVFAGVPLFIYLITKGKGMGEGDWKIGFSLGLILGFPQAVVGFIFSVVIGSSVGLILIALKIKSLKSAIPFGPFLVLGFFIALFWGEYLWRVYFGL
jgi:leader peptidase (prepilin peptidase)/N-methyltransferase